MSFVSMYVLYAMQERRVGKKERKKGWKKVILRPVK
jgi:hypothetical protein